MKGVVDHVGFDFQLWLAAMLRYSQLVRNLTFHGLRGGSKERHLRRLKAEGNFNGSFRDALMQRCFKTIFQNLMWEFEGQLEDGLRGRGGDIDK